MPLVRYRTGDWATVLPTECSCGRNWFRFSKVEGRWKQDMLVGGTGAEISVSALNMHSRIFDKVTRYQYFQDKAGECTLRVMTTPDFGPRDIREIEDAYRKKTGEELRISIRQVPDIPLTARGKLKMLDSRLRTPDSERESS